MAKTQIPPRRVAVLDDDIRFIRMVERVLAQEGIETQPVTTLDLDEAVRVIGESNVDVAMVDIYMYDNAAGFSAIEKLRGDARTARLPLLVTSGARREIGKRVQFLQERGCDVLLKPFPPEELVAHVRAALTPAAAMPAPRPAGAPATLPAVSERSPLLGRVATTRTR